MYEVIADYYDLFMDESEWIEFAVAAVEGYGERGADVGCGSGNVALALGKKYKVVAVDSSPEMLAVASRKFHSHALDIPCVLQDVQKLDLGFKADFITAMCDVVNYIKRPQKFFEAAYKNLRDGGVLVFDISSEYKLKNIIGNNVFTQTERDVTYIWVNSLKKDRVDMELTFFAPTEKGLYKKAVDTQTQYIHSKQFITDSLKRSGFKVGCRSKKDRIYFVAEKVGL